VLHRDLKPESIMLINGGGLRLLDLGLACLAGVAAPATNGLAGTIRYMAPELLCGAGLDDTMDVYALRVILHRLAAFGRLPRPAAGMSGSLLRHRPDIPPRLAAVIAAALETDAMKRSKHAALLTHNISQTLQDAGGNHLSSRRFLEPGTFWRGMAILLGLALLVFVALR
jgi:serine/threonine protein kinase